MFRRFPGTSVGSGLKGDRKIAILFLLRTDLPLAAEKAADRAGQMELAGLQEARQGYKRSPQERLPSPSPELALFLPCLPAKQTLLRGLGPRPALLDRKSVV